MIAASQPSWTAPFTALSARQCGKLIAARRREGADPVRKGGLWSLPLEDRVLWVAAYWRQSHTAPARPVVGGAEVGRPPPSERAVELGLGAMQAKAGRLSKARRLAERGWLLLEAPGAFRTPTNMR